MSASKARREWSITWTGPAGGLSQLGVSGMAICGVCYIPNCKTREREMTSRSMPVRIFLISLVLILTGCAGSGRSIEHAPPAIAAPTSHEPVPADRVSPRDLSPAARSAASANEGGADGLMECVTQSCKINCSTRLEARVRPKWCANFKVPDEANR